MIEPQVSLETVAPSTTRRCAPARSPNNALVVHGEPPRGYVWPRVSHERRADAPVLLLSAPGAMGKSYAAAALSSLVGAPCLDLAYVKVGSGTLAGELGKFLGMAEAGEYLKNVQAGDSALIIDGIDEAQLQSGTEHFFAFMEDLAEQLKGAANDGQVIILGRPDSIAGAEAILAEHGIQFAVSSLLPLGHTEAAELISNCLDQTEYSEHRKNPVPFGELRDAVLEDIARALTGESEQSLPELWSRASDFIGYPPVLGAIAARLQFSNPKAELERVRAHPTGLDASRGELLVQVAERILDRETDKVRGNLTGIPGAGDSPLYTREEQIVRLLVRIGDMDLPVIPPASFPEASKAVYEEHVRGFVADHPFLRDRDFSNIVFADYVRAFVTTSPTIDGYGPSRNTMIQLCPAVGPFYAHFVHALSLRDGRAEIAEANVDDVLRSFQVEDRQDRFSTFAQYKGAARLALLYGARDSTDIGESKGTTDELVFEVDPSTLSGAIEFTAPLTRCIIATDEGLLLRSTSGVCELGPEVILSSEVLEIRADRLLALGEGDEILRGVLIATGEISATPSIRVTARPQAALSIAGIERSHPWGPYTLQVGENREGVSSRELAEGLVYTRRILTSFGKSLGDAPARNIDFVDRVVVGNTSTSQRVFDGLLKIGVVRREPPLYRLDLTELGSFGVSYAALKGSHFEEALGGLVKHILSLD